MRSLPSGTVTFLFTDIEGSTKLLHDLGAEEYSRLSESGPFDASGAFRSASGRA